MLPPFFCSSHGQWEGCGCQGETEIWERERKAAREGQKMLIEIIKLPSNNGGTFLAVTFGCFCNPS